MRRKRLSGKEIKVLNDQLSKEYGLAEFLDKMDNVEVLEDKFVLVNSELRFFYSGERLVPSLKLILANNFLKKVVIDMPAVRFIANGADVMRPGIKKMDVFRGEEIVVVVDEKNLKPLSIGLALFSSEEMERMDKGKVVRNLHHVGDDFWNNILKN
jgi:PUA-domain protein